MKYIPFKDLLLVRILTEKETKSGLILPDNESLRFIRLEVIEKGPDVKDDISIEDVVLAENMVEPVSKTDKTLGLILSKYIVAREEYGREN